MLTPKKAVREIYRRIEEQGESSVWAHLVPEELSIERAEALGPSREVLPLYGMPFAIEDNIDLADVPTATGSPLREYTPSKSAAIVERVIAAGAIPIGKTSLLQRPAAAVASGLVSFAIGTDAAGAGGPSASFHNVAGFTPTRGALSTSGVFPASRTLDRLSIFAQSAGDATRVYEAARGFDPSDPWSRRPAQPKAWPAGKFRFGVPREKFVQFHGDESARHLYRAAIARLENQGGTRVDLHYSIFGEAAQLLESGLWDAERLAACYPGAEPRAAIRLGAGSIGAVSAFDALHRLAGLARAVDREWASMNFMLLPDAGLDYPGEEACESCGSAAGLGYYTNFLSLLDLPAVSVPAGTRADGTPFGVTMVGPAWSGTALLSMAGEDRPWCPAGYVAMAVCGSRLTGQPLNYQLREAGAFLIEPSHTMPHYRLFALNGTVPVKPGLVFTPKGGSKIEVEVWAIPESSFGRIVASVPPPLAIGTCFLENGRKVKSFLCEPFALETADEITQLGGWREYLLQRSGQTA